MTAFQLDFYGTGTGKGLVDGVGGVFAREYATVCTKELKERARFCSSIAQWVEKDFHEFTECDKDSRQKVSYSLTEMSIFYIF